MNLTKFGIIQGSRSQATETRKKYGEEWLVMVRGDLTYTWDHNGAVWRLTRMFDEVETKQQQVPIAKPYQAPRVIRYYTSARKNWVGD